jgi:hypothetical protein
VALLRDTIVSPKLLTRAWDKFWWSEAAKAGLSIQEAQKLTLRATETFVDYCKYNISDYLYPTAGVDIYRELHIGRHILSASVDVLKINLETKYPTTVLVNFTNREIDMLGLALDPEVRTIAYLFYLGKEEIVSYINTNISRSNNKINLTTSTFYPEDMEEIRKMLYHVEQGIGSNAFHKNPYSCNRCKVCKSIKS